MRTKSALKNKNLNRGVKSTKMDINIVIFSNFLVFRAGELVDDGVNTRNR